MIPSINNYRSDRFAYVLASYSIYQICVGIYDGLNREIPGGFALLSMILLYWSIAIWISDDVKKTEVTWINASRFGLFVAWPILVPFYLFQTRKLKAFQEILCYFAFGIFFKILGTIAGSMANG